MGVLTDLPRGLIHVVEPVPLLRTAHTWWQRCLHATWLAAGHPKTIPQLVAVGFTFLPFAFACFLHTLTHTHNGGDDDKMETKSGWRGSIPLPSEHDS